MYVTICNLLQTVISYGIALCLHALLQRSSMLSTSLSLLLHGVCLSVALSQSGIVSKRFNLLPKYFRHLMALSF